MSLRFNLWLIDTTGHTTGVSSYKQQMDWVYYVKNEVVAPAAVTARAAAFKAAGTKHLDTVDTNTCADPGATPTVSPPPVRRSIHAGADPTGVLRRTAPGLRGPGTWTVSAAATVATGVGDLADTGIRARPHRTVEGTRRLPIAPDPDVRSPGRRRPSMSRPARTGAYRVLAAFVSRAQYRSPYDQCHHSVGSGPVRPGSARRPSSGGSCAPTPGRVRRR